MSTTAPAMTVSLSLMPAYAAEDNDERPGPALAESLRRIADAIEANVNIVPYPGSDWTRETQRVHDGGLPLGTYTLDAVPHR